MHSVKVIKSYLEEAINKDAEFINRNDKKYFDSSVYFNSLSTKDIGKIILFAELTKSTMSTFDL